MSIGLQNSKRKQIQTTMVDLNGARTHPGPLPPLNGRDDRPRNSRPATSFPLRKSGPASLGSVGLGSPFLALFCPTLILGLVKVTWRLGCSCISAPDLQQVRFCVGKENSSLLIIANCRLPLGRRSSICILSQLRTHAHYTTQRTWRRGHCIVPLSYARAFSLTPVEIYPQLILVVPPFADPSAESSRSVAGCCSMTVAGQRGRQSIAHINTKFRRRNPRGTRQLFAWWIGACSIFLEHAVKPYFKGGFI